jgi:hypothetical protein
VIYVFEKVLSRVNSSLRDKQQPTDGGRLGNVINETQRVFREGRDGQEMKRNRQKSVNNETSAAFPLKISIQHSHWETI